MDGTMMIDASFYQDCVQKGMKMKGAVNSLKSNMTLDFTTEKTKQRKLADMLNSPDINMLKLASPELERLIIQQGGATTTPTPNTQILFPKSVTEEQEAYARGFVDALAELHQKQESDEDDDDDSMDSSDTSIASQIPTYTTLTTMPNVSNTANAFNFQAGQISSAANAGNNVYTYTTVTQLPSSAMTQASTTLPSTSLTRTQDIIIQNQPAGMRTASPALQFPGSPHPQQLMHVKEEPQRVPSMSPQLGHLTPIDMGQQEGIKIERKRARNRVAARKCRTRKLERISRLEDRVDDLKGQNDKLVNTASNLREQVFSLKQQILEHVNSGCKVMLSANML